MGFIAHDSKYWYFKIDNGEWSQWGMYTQFHKLDYEDGNLKYRRLNLIYPVDKNGEFVEPMILSSQKGLIPLKEYVAKNGYEQFKKSHQSVVANVDSFALVCKLSIDITPDNQIRRSKVNFYFVVGKQKHSTRFIGERGKIYSELVTIDLKDKKLYSALRKSISDDYVNFLTQKVIGSITYDSIADRETFIQGLLAK